MEGIRGATSGRGLLETTKSKPAINDVIQVIVGVSSSWDERKRGKYGLTKHYFHKFCAELSAHSNLLELLPYGNECVSLFTGTITSIVKASVNHEDIAFELSKGLSEITDVVCECTRVCQLYNTEAVQMHIANLYAHIFLFLKDAMSWYLDKHWKRVLRSLRQDFYDDFEEQILNIQRIAVQVKHQADMGLGAEQRVTRLAVEQMQATVTDWRVFADGHARDTAEIQESIRRIERRAATEDRRKQVLAIESPERIAALSASIAANMVDLLEERAGEWTERRQIYASFEQVDARNLDEVDSSSVAPIQPKDLVGREEYLAASRNLELLLDDQHVRQYVELEAQISVSSEISNCLRSFVSDGDQPILAIAGATHLDSRGLSTMTKLAASFMGHAIEIGLPTISWFCDLKGVVESPPESTREVTALLSLTYALIRQLIEMLPLKPKEPIGIKIEEIAGLGDNLETFDVALRVLAELISQLDMTTFIVIDGLQWLDDVSTSQYVNDLLGVLQRSVTQNCHESSGQKPLVRMLLTTAGRSHTILDTLETHLYVLADEGPRSRQRKRGRQLVW